MNDFFYQKTNETSLTELKRRLNFVPLPEPESLHAKYRGTLLGTKLMLHPKAPVTPQSLVITGCLYWAIVTEASLATGNRGASVPWHEMALHGIICHPFL